jgi:hypothetical protein
MYSWVAVRIAEPVQDLKIIKHDFFEKDDSLTVHIYVKNVSKDAVRVLFEDDSFTIKFQTRYECQNKRERVFMCVCVYTCMGTIVV